MNKKMFPGLDLRPGNSLVKTVLRLFEVKLK